MRVTFVQFGGATYTGGLGRCLAEFAVALSRHADVSIVDPIGYPAGPGAAAQFAGVECRRWTGEKLPVLESSSLLGKARLVKALPRLLKVRNWTVSQTRQLAPDIMVSFDFRSAFLVGMSWRLRSIPLMIQLHGWYVPPYMTSYGRWLMRHRADLVVGVSHQTRTALRCAGCDPAKLVVIQNPVDVDAISRDAARPLLTELPGKDAKVRILLPAALSHGKGQRVAVEALSILVSQGLDAYLWLAGATEFGAHEEGYVKQTLDAVATLGLTQRVAWLGHRADIPQLMRAASVVILPSITEGHPRVVLEAMALGKPMVATPVGGVLDMILPEVTGMLFEVGDAKGLAECIRRVTAEPALAQRVSSLGQLNAQTNFSPHRHTQMFMEALEQAIRNRNATA